MTSTKIIKYMWNSDYALYNTLINNGEWSESTAISPETNEEEIYYTICTYKYEIDNNGSKQYLGLKCNDVAKYIIELIVQCPSTIDELTARLAAQYCAVTDEEISECKSTVQELLDLLYDYEFVLIKEYVNYNQYLLNSEETASPDTVNETPIALASTFSLRSATRLSTFTADNNSSDTGGNSESTNEYADIINSILNGDATVVHSSDWEGERPYIDYSVKFRLISNLMDLHKIKGITKISSEDNTEFTAYALVPKFNNDSGVLGWGNYEAAWLVSQFHKNFIVNRELLYDLAVEHWQMEIEVGDITLSEILDSCTTIYNTLVVASRFKKALIVPSDS